MDTIDPFSPNLPAPTVNRSLLGLTVLVIEDSKFACEASVGFAFGVLHVFDVPTVCDLHDSTCRCITHQSRLLIWVCLMAMVRTLSKTLWRIPRGH